MKSSSVDNLGLVLQALSLQILFRDYNNADLMQELQSQDEMYLKTIINQNEKILSILERKEHNDERRNKRKIE